MHNEKKISKISYLSLEDDFTSEEQRTSALCSAAHSVLCDSHDKGMCVREKKGR